MYEFYIYYKDPVTGRRRFLGTVHADSQVQALRLGAMRFKISSGSLVAIQRR